MTRVKVFAGLENAEDNVNKFTHGGADDLHFGFAVAGKALTEGPDDRVMTFGEHFVPPGPDLPLNSPVDAFDFEFC